MRCVTVTCTLVLILLVTSTPFTYALSILPPQPINDGSEIGTAQDIDSDGVEDSRDNCLFFPNSEQYDQNLNGVGDACETPGSEFCEPYGLSFDLDNSGLSDYCEEPAVRSIENIVVNIWQSDLSEETKNKAVTYIYDALLYRGNLSFYLPSRLAIDKEVSQNFYDKMSLAVSVLNDEAQSSEGQAIVENLVLLLSSISELQLLEMKTLVEVEEHTFGTVDFESRLNAEIDKGLDMISRGKNELGQGNYRRGISFFKQSHNQFIGLRSMIFEPIEWEIGPNGGTVQSADGLFELRVPKGAIDETMVISVALSNPEEYVFDKSFGALSSLQYEITSSQSVAIPIEIDLQTYEVPVDGVVLRTQLRVIDDSGNEVMNEILNVNEEGLGRINFETIPSGKLIATSKVEHIVGSSDEPSSEDGGAYGSHKGPPYYVAKDHDSVIYDNEPVGIAGCIAEHGFKAGNRWCGYYEETRSEYKPGYFPTSRKHYTYFTNEAVYINDIELYDPETGKRVNFFEGASIGLGIIAFVGGLVFTAGASGIILTVIGGAGTAAGITSIVIKPSSAHQICSNRAKVNDCNEKDRCNLNADGYDAEDYSCRDDGLMSGLSIFTPMYVTINGTNTTSKAWCEKYESELDCSVLNRKICSGQVPEDPWKCKTTEKYIKKVHYTAKPEGCRRTTDPDDDYRSKDITIEHKDCEIDFEKGDAGLTIVDKVLMSKETCQNDIIRFEDYSCEYSEKNVTLGTSKKGNESRRYFTEIIHDYSHMSLNEPDVLDCDNSFIAEYYEDVYDSFTCVENLLNIPNSNWAFPYCHSCIPDELVEDYDDGSGDGSVIEPVD